MDKAKLKLLLIWSFLIIFIIFSLYFGFIKGSLTTLEQSGFDSDSLYFLLIIPFIVLSLSFWKIILGFKASNTFIPILVILSSFLTGPIFTFMILVFTLLVGYIAKFTISDLRIHFAVKLSLILSILSIGLLIALPFIEKTALTKPGNDHFIITYGILVLSLVNDKYFAFKVDKTKTLTTVITVTMTFLFSFLCFILLGGTLAIGSFSIHFPYLQTLIQNHPDIIFLELILLVLIGRYTGLRLTEIIRFKKLIFNHR